MKALFKQLPAALLPWYASGHRQLPWREDREPYHVWLSEIMLQQTRVEAVKGYYDRFLSALPNVESLANCDDNVLNKLWEGLGYYSRVRNLKKAAVQILRQYNGVFPREYDAVRALPGIGDYTAGAICSICYDLPVPAVDGNVLRVISRITDDPTPIDSPAYKKQVNVALTEVYPADAGNFTQALMELGATVCGPNRKPECDNCPCREFCLGHLRGTAEKLPMKLPKKDRRKEDITVFVLSCNGHYAIEKRQNTGLLAGLWQFPNVSGILDTQQAINTIGDMGMNTRDIFLSLDKNHIFTHVLWNMRGYYLEVTEMADRFLWSTAEEIEENIALPTAFRQFWEARQT